MTLLSSQKLTRNSHKRLTPKTILKFIAKVYSKVNFSFEIINQNVKACIKSNVKKSSNENM